MRRLVGVWLCLAAVPVVYGAEKPPVRSGYLFFSKGDLPNGTARMVVEETREIAPDEGRRPEAQQASWDVVEELGYEYPSPLPELDQPSAPTYGAPTVSPLAGARWGYTYGGRRYTAHCYTAPGYERACCEPIYALAPCEYYRVKCCRPGLLGCLLGCPQPHCKLVRVRPGLCAYGIYDVRCPTVPVPLYAADWESRELVWASPKRKVVERKIIEVFDAEAAERSEAPAALEGVPNSPAPTPGLLEGPSLSVPGA